RTATPRSTASISASRRRRRPMPSPSSATTSQRTTARPQTTTRSRPTQRPRIPTATPAVPSPKSPRGDVDPTTFDPQTFDLGIVLTAAGVPIAAAIIASVIQLAKRIPVAGPALDAGKEAIAAMVLAAGLIALAFGSVGVPITIVSVFGAFLAWVNLA